MGKKYWRKKAERLEREKEADGQFGGCAALFLTIIGFVIYGLLIS
jgi:hypothetical protein